MGLFGKAAGAVLPFGILDLLDPDRAEAATFPGFVKQFPKLVTVEGRKELRKLGLLDENGRMYVGTLEPEVFEVLKQRDKSVIDDNLWMSRHAPDQRLKDGISPEELAQDIADLVDSKDARILGNFPTRFPQPDRAKWMLAGKKGDYYTAAPLRTGDFGDVEFKTVLRPVGSNKTYLDKSVWGGALVPSLFTQEMHPEQSNTQPSRLSAVSRPYQQAMLSQANAPVNQGAAVWPIQTPDGRLLWPADVPGYRNTEPGLEAPLVDPIDIAVAPIGAATWGGRAAAMAAEPVLSYGLDRMFSGLADMARQGQRPAENPAMAGLLQMLAERK